MPAEFNCPPKARSFLAVLLCAAFALSACIPTTTEKPMTGSNNPSDPATVMAQVEELKQALEDLHAFKTETQKAIGPQTWKDKGARNSGCTTLGGQDGVNYIILSQTADPVDLESSTEIVRTLWESKGFTTRTETNPGEPGLIRLYAHKGGERILSYFANVKGSGLEMDTACVAGDLSAIYKELDRQDASSSPVPATT
ncbi:hypothetical protein ACPFL9_01335 [Paenarthrobacter sp. NyZ202]|uniref:hypothetical protein n=1 Tax=Paenarthrobacter sp. NyZ202 TaxID=3402689 RepID=UPI003CF000E3